jgi:hypothetical protein
LCEYLSREAAKLVRRSQESSVLEAQRRDEFIRDVAKKLVAAAIDAAAHALPIARRMPSEAGLAECSETSDEASWGLLTPVG